LIIVNRNFDEAQFVKSLHLDLQPRLKPLSVCVCQLSQVHLHLERLLLNLHLVHLASIFETQEYGSILHTAFGGGLRGSNNNNKYRKTAARYKMWMRLGVSPPPCSDDEDNAVLAPAPLMPAPYHVPPDRLRVNLELQEKTLEVQMDLQRELLRQLRLQERLQIESERLDREWLTLERLRRTMVAPTVEDSTASAYTSKMNIVREIKQRLHHELTAHLRMQHQLLLQLNRYVILPAGGVRVAGADAPVPSKDESGPAVADWETASTKQA